MNLMHQPAAIRGPPIAVYIIQCTQLFAKFISDTPIAILQGCCICNATESQSLNDIAIPEGEIYDVSPESIDFARLTMRSEKARKQTLIQRTGDA